MDTAAWCQRKLQTGITGKHSLANWSGVLASIHASASAPSQQAIHRLPGSLGCRKPAGRAEGQREACLWLLEAGRALCLTQGQHYKGPGKESAQSGPWVWAPSRRVEPLLQAPATAGFLDHFPSGNRGVQRLPPAGTTSWLQMGQGEGLGAKSAAKTDKLCLQTQRKTQM